MKYIAYGSNMSTTQMNYRCPRSVLMGTGFLHGARLEFYHHATVEFTNREEDIVPVAVWELNKADERSLDRYEGFPDYYSKCLRRVKMKDGSEIVGMLYTMNKPIDICVPDDWYFLGIEDAYRELGFEREISTILEAALARIAVKDKNL